jgi:hypothetical protein
MLLNFPEYLIAGFVGLVGAIMLAVLVYLLSVKKLDFEAKVDIYFVVLDSSGSDQSS